jgi:hypothetical protein
MGLVCLTVLTPAAKADFISSEGFCCFSVSLTQGTNDVVVTVNLIDGATSFANTGNGSNHPGFAFNLDTTITGANISGATNLGAFHVGPDQSNGPDFGTFGYFFDIPGQGSGSPGPLSFTVNKTGILVSDFIANDEDVLFAADVCQATSGNGACTGEAAVTGTPGLVTPEPVSLSLVGGGLLALGLLRKRLPRP